MEGFMKKVFSILSLALLSHVGAAWAQFAPVNEAGLAWGHLHLYPPDRQKEVLAWISLGGKLGFNLSSNTPILFPGLLILINNPQGNNKNPEAPLGSVGSLVDHVTFKVRDLQASTTEWKGFVTWWLPLRSAQSGDAGMEGNWGLKVEPGSRPDQAWVTTPGGVKIEVIEEKSLKVPIAFEAIHFYTVQSDLPKIQDYYTKMFGAAPVNGEANTLSMPGGKLMFTVTATPPLPTIGRTLDHIGFNADTADALAKFTKDVTAKGAKFYRPPRNSAFGQTALVDGFGTFIEVNKGQRGYFDLKQIESNTYLVDEQGRTEEQVKQMRQKKQ
jgi:catechol 2,3-dioxygenase-like lactoylglutathione lyase family enzyme